MDEEVADGWPLDDTDADQVPDKIARGDDAPLLEQREKVFRDTYRVKRS